MSEARRATDAAVFSVEQAFRELQAGRHPAALAQLNDCLAFYQQKLTAEVVESWRAAGGSWAEIGGALGISRQAAWTRYAHRMPAGHAGPAN